MDENYKILIIVPAYNEEKSICSVYKNIINHNKTNNTNYDVVVINDGSTDNTKDICLKNNIPLIDLKINSGIGSAVQAGYKYASLKNYDIAIQFDGDGQHDIRFIKNIINPIINNNANMVIGSRFIRDSKGNFKSSGARRAGIKIISFFIKLFTKSKIYDTTSGFRAVDRNIIKYFSLNYPKEYPEPVSTIDILKLNYKIKEVPVIMHERTTGKSSIRKWKVVYFMVDVIFSMFIEYLGGYKYEY